MTEEQAYDQMREAGAALNLAARGLQRGDDPARWQRIIDTRLDQWLKARDVLRRHRAVAT